MQPQQPFGAPKQPLRPTTSQNPFLAQRPVAMPAASAMPMMQTAASRPAMAGGPMVGNPTVGNPMMNNPMAASAPAPAPAPVASNMNANPFDNFDEPKDDFGAKDSMVAESSDNEGGEKKNNNMLYVAIGCGVLALAGIGFGVFGMMKKPETKVETKVEAVISEATAANLTAPYLVNIMPNVYITNTGLTDAAKFWLTYRNLPVDYVQYMNSSEGVIVVGYNEMNAIYKNLFGGDLLRSSYGGEGTGYPTAVFDITEGGTEQFVITNYNGYGSIPGVYPIVKIKEITSTENGFNVAVYSDNVYGCGAGAPVGIDVPEGYCFVELSDTVDSFVESHADMIPVKNMVFTESDGRYVLSDIVDENGEGTTTDEEEDEDEDEEVETTVEGELDDEEGEDEEEDGEIVEFTGEVAE